MGNFKELYLDQQLSGQKVKHQVNRKKIYFTVNFDIVNVKIYQSLSDYNKVNPGGYLGFHLYFTYVLKFVIKYS